MRLQFASLVLLAACAACAGEDAATPPAVSAPEPAETAEGVTAAAEASETAVSLQAPRLEQLWVQEGFSQPEGAALGPDGTYFISNVGGHPLEKDGDGFISKVDTDGTILMMRWAEELHAPKGMVVHEDVLYVSDIDRVVTFDALNGTRLGEVPVEGAVFLNDATVWNDRVIVSDSGTAKLHFIGPDKAEEFGASADWDGANGVLGDEDRLLLATMTAGHLIEITSDKRERKIASGMINADGIGLVPGGGYLVSGWKGQIHFASEDGEVVTLLDSEADGIGQNDLSVFGDVVIVPNMQPGTVTAWKVVRD